MKSPQPYVELALEAAKRAASYAPGSEAEFRESPVVQDAICMRLQEAGENLSKIRQQFPEFYEKHQTESWHRLIGLRNVISHGYGDIDMLVVWQIVSIHLGGLVTELDELHRND